ADRDVERQFGQAARAAPAAVARSAPARRRLPAGDQARRRALRRAARRRARRPRLRARPARRDAVERGGDPLARRARRRGPGHPRWSGLPESGGSRGVGLLRRDPRRLGVRAERAHAGLRPLPLQAHLARRVARHCRRPSGGDVRLR
ncbi:MAG: Exodeoxyribonuclease III, partial [uncultured Solirubrobacteraceae bacterium]